MIDDSGQGATITPSMAIALMKRGGTLLKCGNHGSPHFREFKLSDDLKTLSWTSPKKKSVQSTISISDIQEIRVGQNTPIFRKNRKPEYENVSFSVIYAQKTLDIVCKNRKEFETWTTGLRTLSSEPDKIDVGEIDGLKETDETVTVKFKGKKTIIQKREDNNDVYSWGQGVNGRLGHGDENDQLIPKVVEALLGKDVRGIACGPSHTAAWTAGGEVYTWGAGSNGRLGHGHERDRFTPLVISALRPCVIVQVACGDYHTAAVTNAGKVFSWGKGGDGRLGVGDDKGSLAPREVEALDGVVVKSIACGYVTTAAVTDKGQVYMWGGCEKGQLGLGSKESQMLPQHVSALDGRTISQVACATWHTAAITVSGEVYTWGDGVNGKLGHGDEEEQLLPKQVSSIANIRIIQIACGDFHTAVLTDTGEVHTWGEGNYGQLGHGPAVTTYTKPLLVGQPLQGNVVVQISCGSNHTAALTDKGQLYTWGNAANGRLGHGDESDQKLPRLVSTMQGKKVREVACGGSHSAAMIVHGWIPDDESNQCMACKTQFTVIRRRHHCRNCGGLFCGSCSSKKYPLLQAGFSKNVRVCDKCHGTLAKSGK